MKKIKKILEKQHYSVCNHSAVQVCRWTKKSLTGKGSCYKEKFYGIKSHGCCQMSPMITCQNKCLHCWRPIELKVKLKKKFDDPKTIIENCIKSQRKLLSGFGGNKKIDLKKYSEAQAPSQFAISLIGEPTLYPYLGELIKELRKRKITSFLVTNGLKPEALKALGGNTPTQLYVSLLYPNEKLFRKITQNKKKDSWKQFNKTLRLLPKLKTRTVIRMTLVRDLNMEDEMLEEYAELINLANPDFVEVKGFMSVGFSRKRLAYDRMPMHEEIIAFSKKLAKLTKLELLDDKMESRVVLLGKNKKKMKITEKEI